MKRLIALPIFLLMTACASHPVIKNNPTVVVDNKPAPVPNTKAIPTNLKSVEWKTYTTEELKAMIAQLEKNGQTNARFYVMTEDEFKILALNIAEMQRYIADQQSIKEFLVKAIQINNSKVSPQK